MNKSSRVVESPREFTVEVVVREQTEVVFKQFVSFTPENILVFGIPSQKQRNNSFGMRPPSPFTAEKKIR